MGDRDTAHTDDMVEGGGAANGHNTEQNQSSEEEKGDERREDAWERGREDGRGEGRRGNRSGLHPTELQDGTGSGDDAKESADTCV